MTDDACTPGHIWADAGAPLTWPLPWPARLILAVDPTRGQLWWADEFSTGWCSIPAFRRRNASYGLVDLGPLVEGSGGEG